MTTTLTNDNFSADDQTTNSTSHTLPTVCNSYGLRLNLSQSLAVLFHFKLNW